MLIWYLDYLDFSRLSINPCNIKITEEDDGLYLLNVNFRNLNYVQVISTDPWSQPYEINIALK